jgi:SAM-dependent methyltransferase
VRAEAIIRAGLDDWKRRSPASFWRARNGAALARWFWVRLQRRMGARPNPYDDAFWSRQETGDWNAVADLLGTFVAPRSVADIGCGQGLLMEAILRRMPEAAIVGLDDSDEAVARARRRGLTVLHADIAGASSSQIEKLADALGPRDLTMCLEVAEHLPSWHSAKLLRLLTVAPVVFFSAAHPNQGGVLHVNERPAPYWQERFAAIGYRPSDRSRELRDQLRTIDLPPWYAQNAQLFERGALAGGAWRARGC